MTLKIQKLSASSYKVWSHCPHKFVQEQALNYRYPAGKAANIGTITHAILEILAQIKLARQNNKLEVDTDIGELNADKIDIDTITEKTYKHYTVGEFVKQTWTDADFKAVKKYVNIALTHNSNKFNPLNRQILSTEQYVKIPINEDWAILPDKSQFCITGFIDLVTQENNDVIECFDYKTGALTDFFSGEQITYEYLQKDPQLRFYHLALSEIYGCDKNYLLTLFFLKFAKIISVSFSCEDLIQTKEMIKNRFLEISNCKTPKRRSIDWKCRKFCEFAKNSRKDAPIQFLDGQVTAVGNPMCLCDMHHFEVARHGLDWVVENMKNE